MNDNVMRVALSITLLPSIFDALPDQLGLKLETSRAQVPVLVVDSIERPTPN